MSDTAFIADMTISGWQRDWHRAQAANFRAQAAVLDRYEMNSGWRMDADETEFNREVAADLRKQAGEHEAKARAT